jgi:photosystem II stability/assembly factor-like uncharacterized protein
LILFLLLGPVAGFSQGTWTRENIPTTQFLRSVCFTDSLYGWVAGDSGTILHTTDGGNTWISQGPQTSNEIQCVFFLDRNRGWATEFNYSTTPYGTILHKTTNGGATWQSMTFPTVDVFMSCVVFTDSLKGWMGGRPSGIFKSADGGATWSACAIDTSVLAFFPVEDIQFFDDKYGYACGGILDIAGVVWRTSDGGNKWYAIDVAYAPADEVHGMHLFDSLNVLGAGGDPDFGYGVGMLRTSDGGYTWSYDELNIQGNAYDIGFRNGQEAWAPLGPKRKLIYSLDAGVNWTPVLSPDSTAIYRMTFPDSLHGFATGKNGAFLVYHPPVIPAVGPGREDGEKVVLYQNFPNPVTSLTTFRFLLPMPGTEMTAGPSSYPRSVRISISDILGHEIAVIEGIVSKPGHNEVSFDASGLPDGCYFYRLEAAGSGQTVLLAGPGRMIVAGQNRQP